MSEILLSIDDLTFTTIELELKSHVLTITLDRQERKNAINETMTSEMIYALDFAKQESDVRVIVLAARGNVFCAGGDLKGMAGQAGSGPVSNVPKRGEIDDMVLKLYHIHKPVIAKIQGPVLAGALLMVCNATHAIAVDSAFFAAPEILRGLWPFQVMAGLFRIMPQRMALDWIMRGYRMDATTALRSGLISQIVSADQLDEQVTDLACELSSLAPETMQTGLAAFRAQEAMKFDDALPYLRTQFEACVKTENAREGIAAFLEKRQPRWN